jgi:hypothetical protein
MSTYIKKVRIAVLALVLISTLVPSIAPALAQTTSSATTYYADNITQTSANLYGSSTFPPSDQWFEVKFPNGQVYSVDANNGAGFVYNLTAGTTYSYRYVAVAADGSQTCYGAWVDFTTQSAPQPQVCQDPNASNYHGPLPCQYPPQTCQDPAASNYHTGYPCTYPAPKCTDPSATNYGGALPCQYPAKCTDPGATNYGGSLPCQYPAPKCTDPSATNYGGALPCQYPAAKCTDPAATNYNGSLPCQYPARCTDPAATNYNQIGACQYPARCTDPAATNYNQIGACQYPARCTDPAATNYNQVGTCQYPSRCTDPAATNYNQVGTCQYQSRCTDPNAINYNQIGSCQYQARCTDPNATNYNQIGTCQYQSRCSDPNATNYGSIGTCYYQSRCTDPSATNYNQVGACQYQSRCTDPSALNYNGSLPCQYPVQQCQAPTVSLSGASNVGQTSATLGAYIDPHGRATTYWFVYAPVNGNSVQTQGPIYNAQSVSSAAYNLNPNTNYTFNVVAQNSCGTTYGQSAANFRTGGTVTVTNPPIVRTTPPIVVTTVNGSISGGSCLILTPAITPGNPLPGQEFNYSITYRNTCPFDLRNASMRTYLPNEVSFTATSYPFIARDLNVITYSLGTIPMNFQGTILVKGVVNPTVQPGVNLLFRSDLSFLDNKSRMQTVSASLTAVTAGAAIVGGTAAAAVGTASVFSSLFGFLSSGWFWFLLFLLLLALFILWLATRNREAVVVEHE